MGSALYIASIVGYRFCVGWWNRELMDSETKTSLSKDVSPILLKASEYFAHIGATSVLLRTPVFGYCNSLELGLIRSCILCSHHVHTKIRMAICAKRKSHQLRLNAGETENRAEKNLNEKENLEFWEAYDQLFESRTKNSGLDDDAPLKFKPDAINLEEALISMNDEEYNLKALPILIEKIKYQILDVVVRHYAKCGPPLPRVLLDHLALDPLLNSLAHTKLPNFTGLIVLLCRGQEIAQGARHCGGVIRSFLSGRPWVECQTAQNWAMVIAGGVVRIGQSPDERELTHVFCSMELEEDARYYLVRMLVLHLLGYVAWLKPQKRPSKTCFNVPCELLSHFPLPAIDFLTRNKHGLNLERHAEVPINFHGSASTCRCLIRAKKIMEERRRRQMEKQLRALEGTGDATGEAPDSEDSGDADAPVTFYWTLSAKKLLSLWKQNAEDWTKGLCASLLEYEVDSPMSMSPRTSSNSIGLLTRRKCKEYAQHRSDHEESQRKRSRRIVEDHEDASSEPIASSSSPTSRRQSPRNFPPISDSFSSSFGNASRAHNREKSSISAMGSIEEESKKADGNVNRCMAASMAQLSAPETRPRGTSVVAVSNGALVASSVERSRSQIEETSAVTTNPAEMTNVTPDAQVRNVLNSIISGTTVPKEHAAEILKCIVDICATNSVPSSDTPAGGEVDERQENRILFHAKGFIDSISSFLRAAKQPENTTSTTSADDCTDERELNGGRIASNQNQILRTQPDMTEYNEPGCMSGLLEPDQADQSRRGTYNTRRHPRVKTELLD